MNVLYTFKENIKENIKSWISFRKVQRIIKCKQKASLKSYIDMNLRKKIKK